jgi:hypothetical protein
MRLSCDCVSVTHSFFESRIKDLSFFLARDDDVVELYFSVTLFELGMESVFIVIIKLMIQTQNISFAFKRDMNHRCIYHLLVVFLNMLIVRAFCHKATTHNAPRLAFRNHPSSYSRKTNTGSVSAPLSIRRSGSSSTFLQSHFAKSDDHVVVTYLTDVEGDKAYLDRYVNLSQVLKFQKVTPRLVDHNSNDESSESSESSYFPYDHCMEFSIPNGMLVYGGDVWDKGGNDLYVIRQLVDLKRRHPDRVQIVLGNRDMNKLRMLQELGIKGHPLPHHPGLNFLRGTGRMGDPDFQLPPVDAVERLKWILSRSMGSPNAFELRKAELEWEQKELLGSSKEVTDEDVVISYQTSCHPKGELGQYLSDANLAVRLGQVLFVHGSLPLTQDILHERESDFWDDLTCYMPWLQDDAKTNHGVTTIDDWLDALNGFCHTKVQQWNECIAQVEDEQTTTTQEENAIWTVEGGYHYGPSYSGLMQYGMGMVMAPERKSNPTCVYSSWMTNGMPHRFYPNADEQRFAQATKEFFEKAQLRLIVAGHQPQGDMPSPIRINTTSVEPSWVLCCDTSYSGDTLWYHLPEDTTTTTTSQQQTPPVPQRSNLGRGTVKSFRGDVAVSEVLIQLDAQQTIQSVKYHGVLSDGSEYETINLIDDADATAVGQIAPDSLVPSETDSPHQGPWWTKMVFSDGSHLFHQAEGYSAWNLFHPKQ